MGCVCDWAGLLDEAAQLARSRERVGRLLDRSCKLVYKEVRNGGGAAPEQVGKRVKVHRGGEAHAGCRAVPSRGAQPFRNTGAQFPGTGSVNALCAVCPGKASILLAFFFGNLLLLPRGPCCCLP